MSLQNEFHLTLAREEEEERGLSLLLGSWARRKQSALRVLASWKRQAKCTGFQLFLLDWLFSSCFIVGKGEGINGQQMNLKSCQFERYCFCNNF